MTSFSFNLFTFLPFIYGLLLLLLIQNQRAHAFFIIFKLNSQIDFNENEKNIYFNNQYQYYTIDNIDMPGRRYSYDNMMNSAFLYGYLNNTNDAYHCKLLYNLYNHPNDTDIEDNSKSEKNLNKTLSANFNKNLFYKMNTINITYDYTKNQLYYKEEIPIKQYHFGNVTNSNSTNRIKDKSNTYNNKNHLKSLTISINHTIITNNNNNNDNNNNSNNYNDDDDKNNENNNDTSAYFKKMIKSNHPILFINYEDLITSDCTFQEIISANHWNFKNLNETTIINNQGNKTKDKNNCNKNNKNNNCTDDFNISNFNPMEDRDDKNEVSDDEITESNLADSIIPSLIVIVVKEKTFESIKKESNINMIGMKYLQQTLNSDISMTFIPEKDYRSLLNDSNLNELWIKVTPGKYYKLPQI